VCVYECLERNKYVQECTTLHIYINTDHKHTRTHTHAIQYLDIRGLLLLLLLLVVCVIAAAVCLRPARHAHLVHKPMHHTCKQTGGTIVVVVDATAHLYVRVAPD
jgi:hypothetical protein